MTNLTFLWCKQFLQNGGVQNCHEFGASAPQTSYSYEFGFNQDLNLAMAVVNQLCNLNFSYTNKRM